MRLKAGRETALRVHDGRNVILVVLQGTVRVNGEKGLREAQMALLARDGTDVLLAAESDATVLLLSGEPIDEPIAGHGPFVMNTFDEVDQAVRDYNSGRLVARST